MVFSAKSNFETKKFFSFRSIIVFNYNCFFSSITNCFSNHSCFSEYNCFFKCNSFSNYSCFPNLTVSANNCAVPGDCLFGDEYACRYVKQSACSDNEDIRKRCPNKCALCPGQVISFPKYSSGRVFWFNEE